MPGGRQHQKYWRSQVLGVRDTPPSLSLAACCLLLTGELLGLLPTLAPKLSLCAFNFLPTSLLLSILSSHSPACLSSTLSYFSGAIPDQSTLFSPMTWHGPGCMGCVSIIMGQHQCLHSNTKPACTCMCAPLEEHKHHTEEHRHDSSCLLYPASLSMVKSGLRQSKINRALGELDRNKSNNYGSSKNTY